LFSWFSVRLTEYWSAIEVRSPMEISCNPRVLPVVVTSAHSIPKRSKLLWFPRLWSNYHPRARLSRRCTSLAGTWTCNNGNFSDHYVCGNHRRTRSNFVQLCCMSRWNSQFLGLRRDFLYSFFAIKIFANRAETPGIFVTSHFVWRSLKSQKDQCAWK